MDSTQNPATLAAYGAPVTDLAGASIIPDNRHSIRALQVTPLTGFCANTEAKAAIVDPLIFGEALTRQIWKPGIGTRCFAARSRGWRGRRVIHDHTNIWLLRPGAGGFCNLPRLLDDADQRGGAEQFGERWEPLGDVWWLEGSTLHGAGSAFDLLGTIWLRAANELVMVFEGGMVAIVQSDWALAVPRLDFEVAWIELPANSSARVMAGGS
jgi:hypothetical protein